MRNPETLYQVRIHDRGEEGEWGDATLWHVREDGTLFNDSFGGVLEGYTACTNVHGTTFVAHGARLFIVDLVTDWRETEFWCSTLERAESTLNVFFPRFGRSDPFSPRPFRHL